MLTNTLWNCNIANNCTCQYGASALYKQQPPATCLECGVAPLDSLPAQWWNWLWNEITHRVTPVLAQTLQYFYDELSNAILCNGIVALCNTDSSQLSQAIKLAAQKVATDSVAGAIKSSSDSGEIAVDSSTGIATVNGLGTPSSLTTDANTVVGGINELVTKYTNLASSVVPVSHASSTTMYGVGSSTDYGHVKLAEDTIGGCSTCNAEAGVAATPLNIYCALGGRSKVTYTLSGSSLCICLQ